MELWWIWMWAICGSDGQPFMWTMSVNGVGGRDVIAEASLAKVALAQGADPKHAKATVWHAANAAGTSNNWGIDGDPIRYLPACSYMTFALEVAGPSTFASMTGKLFFQ
jgi:hypothetical protein